MNISLQLADAQTAANKTESATSHIGAQNIFILIKSSRIKFSHQ